MTLQEIFNILQGITDPTEQDRLLEDHGWTRSLYDNCVKTCGLLLPTPGFLQQLHDEQDHYRTDFAQCTKPSNERHWPLLTPDQIPDFEGKPNGS